MTSRRTPRARRIAAATAAFALLAVGVAACSSSNDSATSGGAAGADTREAPAPEAAGERPAAAGGSGARQGAFDSDTAALAETSADSFEAEAPAEEAAPEEVAPEEVAAEPGDPRSLIKQGSVALQADDVDQVRFDVTTLVEAAGGEVSAVDTEADTTGEGERARLTVRVPEDRFSEVMEGLEGVEAAALVSISSTTEDVSTQVIDTQVRVELKERSIDRISVLLDRATSIRDIVGIERELARREADLGSLQKKQAFLADQTSLSTISIAISRPPVEDEEEPVEEEQEESGFAAGLTNGWDAFVDVTTGLLTATGAVLPFAVVLLLVGIPARLLIRRRRPVSVTSDAQTA